VTTRGCVTPRVQTVSFPICAVVEAGAMHGRGIGDLTPRSARSAWVGAGGGAAVLWRPAAVRDRLGLLLRAEGLAALTRPVFGTEARTIYQAGPAGGRFLVGLTVRLAGP
jgi:hypothetical protein